MRNPAELYEVLVDLDTVPRGLDLVAGLTGFADAGGAVGQIAEHLIGELDGEEIVRFVGDELLDYRSRRPVMRFEETRLTDYDPPELSIFLLEDEMGRPFLLLTGYEPDLQWERFATAIVDLVARLGVARSTWLHAIPMPVPHTRPIGVTVSGNREDVIDAMSVWRPTTQLPGTAMHLVEYRLTERDHPTAGLVMLVPHYLGDTTFPGAAVAALEAITSATGLVLPTDELREENRLFLSKIEEQVGGNHELQRLIETLEQRHDSYVRDNPLPSRFADPAGNLPTADQIAEELQKFLARQQGDGLGDRDA